MNIRSPLFREFLQCRKDVENEHNVAIEKEDPYRQPKFVGHVLLPNVFVQAEIIEERIN